MVKPNQPMEYVIDKNGNGRLVAKKNKHRKHDTDDSYGNPKGGKNIQNLPQAY